MPHQPRVFDTWGLLAFMQGEPAAPKVAALLAEAREAGQPALATVVNLGEVWYTTARKRGDTEADATIADLLRLGVVAVSVDWEFAQQAAWFKSKYKLAFGDCFAAALAKLRNLEVVTGDPEFDQLSDQVKILWL